MTLLNQKGSSLRRGNLLVIPIADSLLYVEPFFLQAEGGGALPELRIVAAAVQDKLGTGKNFGETLSVLFPGFVLQQPGLIAGGPPSGAQPGAAQPGAVGGAQPLASGNQPGPGAQPSPGPPPAQAPLQGTGGTADTARLARQARQLLDDYGKLASQGRYQEAGQKLDQLKQTLDELSRKQ